MAHLSCPPMGASNYVCTFIEQPNNTNSVGNNSLWLFVITSGRDLLSFVRHR